MRVTVGVSGGIAAYKAAELVRALQRHALEVHVVMTASAVLKAVVVVAGHARGVLVAGSGGLAASSS